MAELLNLPKDTAEKWRSKFGRQLARVASEAVDTHLRQYREEYEVIQSRSLGVLPKLVDGIEANARIIASMAENGGKADPELIGQTVSALKAVYSLAEAASGADVAKKRASQKPVSAGKGDGKLALPDLGAFFLADSVEVEDESPLIASPENPSINETGNENPVDPAETPEK